MPFNDPDTLYDGYEIRRPPAGAVGLSAIRILGDGSMRQYSSVEFTRGWNGVERFVRTLMKLGMIRPTSKEPSYALLDVLDENEDIIGDYDIVDARAFHYVYRKLKLRVVNPPAEVSAS